ncbi:deazapurine DNA modification protein DpdA family protein [Paraburkholderia polaris]
MDDYLKSLDLTMEVWNRHAWLAPPALMGLGSTCRRDLHHPKLGLFAILDGLDGRLPAGMKLHCFGVKGAALERVKMYPFEAGTDSMAFDVTARRNAFAAGISNTMEHRSTVMTNWMQAAEARMRPQPGDQFRLTF